MQDQLDVQRPKWEGLAMAREIRLPRISRVAFFRCKDGDLIHALTEAIDEFAREKPDGEISDAQLALHTWGGLLVDVFNGGFTQFFFNHRGAGGIEPLCEMLESLELPKIAALLRQAVPVYEKYAERFAVKNPWDGLFGSIEEFETLDRKFFNVGVLKANAALDGWIRRHIGELAVGDDGNAIDPAFTGRVEIQNSTGLVAEMLEVKKGKASGAYKEFFDDGTVRHVTFYKSGKLSGDYWPNGQLKKKQSRRGKQNVIEFFYPSGKLQKGIVLEKSGEYAESIRRFHENGQLAEELTMKGGKKCGPWLKFFEDGSPELEAEYKDDQEKVIYNSWDAERQQVVKDGKGVFKDDSPTIDWQYDVFFENGWPRIIELESGIANGTTTTFRDGVVWSIDSYANGKLHGESTTYWDNGQIRSVVKFNHGKEVTRKEFPKFVKPEPAVLLQIEASERLYTAWDHIPVDQYPQAENAEQIKLQLRPPQFLLDVYQRNRAGEIKNEYEDWNTFNDGITYFLKVGADGAVTEVTANGSSVCSGGEWETYKPLLKQLRFAPGRVCGRAVECGVIARVQHTFVEGTPACEQNGIK